MKGNSKKSFLKYLSLSILPSLASTLTVYAGESYREYVDRINSPKHIMQAGEDLIDVLKKNGYTDILTYHGALNQTYWKNGIRPNEPLLPGQVILLPYREDLIIVPLRVAHKKVNKAAPRRPANTEEEVPLPLIEERPPQSRIHTFVGFDYFSIDAVDKETKDTANIVSEASPKVGLSWELLFNEDWSAELGFLYREEKIKDDPTSQRHLVKKSYPRLSTHFGINRIWSERNKTQIFVARSERGFIRAQSATELKIDSGASTDIGLKHESVFYQRKTASIGTELMATYLGKAETGSYSSEEGYSGKTGLFMRHQMKDFLLEGKVSYSIWKQDSPYVTQEAKELGTSVGIGWIFE